MVFGWLASFICMMILYFLQYYKRKKLTPIIVLNPQNLNNKSSNEKMINYKTMINFGISVTLLAIIIKFSLTRGYFAIILAYSFFTFLTFAPSAFFVNKKSKFKMAVEVLKEIFRHWKVQFVLFRKVLKVRYRFGQSYESKVLHKYYSEYQKYTSRAYLS